MPRHLMEPDPDAPAINPVAALWLVVVVLAFALMLAALAR